MLHVNAWEKLLFWYHNIEYFMTLNISMANLSGSAQVPPGLHTQMPVIVVMVAIYVVELEPDVANGQWSEVESQRNSTWRELKAIYIVLKLLCAKNKKVTL